MERFYNVEDVCVLVSNEGTYHLERVFRDKSEVYVGALDTAGIDGLRARLNEEKLRNLSQQDIAAPLNSDTLDHLWISINRGTAPQNLSFGNVASRNPYRESIDPLLKWLDAIEKDRPGAVETGGAPTRCLPPKSIGLLAPENQSLTKGTSESKISQIERGSFLFRIVTDHYRGGDAERNCTIVYSDGRYRLEKSVQSSQANMKAKVYENSLQPGSLVDLKRILDAPELKSSEHRNLPEVGRPFHDADITLLTIPRPGAAQVFAFSSYFNTLGSMREPGGASNLQYGVGNDTQLLKPLHKWMKTNLEDRKMRPLPGAVATGCLPSQP